MTKKNLRKETIEDVFAGRTLGELMVDGVTELANDLKSGIDITTKYNVHNIVSPSKPVEFTPEEAQAARTALNASQAVFAQFLGLSANAVRTWEQGQGKPNKAVRTIFRFIREDPTYWQSKFLDVMSIDVPGKNTAVEPKRKKSPSTRRKAERSH